MRPDLKMQSIITGSSSPLALSAFPSCPLRLPIMPLFTSRGKVSVPRESGMPGGHAHAPWRDIDFLRDRREPRSRVSGTQHRQRVFAKVTAWGVTSLRQCLRHQGEIWRKGSGVVVVNKARSETLEYGPGVRLHPFLHGPSRPRVMLRCRISHFLFLSTQRSESIAKAVSGNPISVKKSLE